jgi:hypothetical protein
LATTNNQIVDADSVQVEGVVVDPAGIERASYQINGGAEQPIQIGRSAKAPFSFSAELVDGDNVVVVNGYNRRGNLGYATLRVRRLPDVSPPAIVLDNPVDGISTVSGSVNVAGTATDNRSVGRVSIQVNGAPEQVLPVGAGRTVTFSTALTGLRAGQNSIAVHAYDRAGNRGAVTRVITVSTAAPPPAPAPVPPPDTTAPTVSITQPSAGAALSTTSVGVSAVVADNVALTRAGWKLNGGVETPITVSGPTATLNFTASGLNQGTNSIAVNAYDAAGNVGTSLVNVVVQFPSPPSDTTPPTLVLSAPADGATVNTSSVTVVGSASDAVGVTRVAVQLNGGAEQDASVTRGPAVSFSRIVSGLANGTNVIVVNAYDAAGNKGSTSIRVTYSAPSDTIAPTLTIAAPADGATVNSGTVAASGRASDNLAVTRVTSQVNGGPEVDVSISSGSSTSFSGTFGPLVAGTNTIRFNAYDAVGNRGSATVSIHYTPPPTTGAVFPLRVEAGKRYLVDAAGNPFLMQGDSPWSLMVQLTREQVDQYLDDRRARGFNTLLVNLIEHHFSNNPPKNAYGQAPFLTPGDYGTPNEQYFAHVDWVIQRAADKGFLLLLVPSYLGYGGGDQGWYQEMVANGSTKLREFGRYLGRRYASFSNILWTHGGDYNPPNKALVREIALGIREFDTRALMSAHCAPETAAVDYWGGESWLQVNNVYTYNAVYSAALAQYARSDQMPFFFLEGRYENEADGTEQRVRVQAYHALLSGATGQVFGNNPIWHFNGPALYPTSLTWQQALNGPGSQSMSHVRSLFAPRAWWTLQPDANNALLTSGLGSGQDRAVAARAADGSFAIAYLPSIRTVTVNLGQLAGPRVNARWYDPANATYTAVTGSPFPASGSQTFRPASNNASGFADWVLVLESSQ